MKPEPASSNQKEGKTFEPLKKIYHQVRQAAKIRSPSLKHTVNGSKTLDSDSTNSLRPDAYLQLWESSFAKRESTRDYWVDVVMVVVFKKVLDDVKARDVRAFDLAPVQLLIP
jgi:hypothetical protein